MAKGKAKTNSSATPQPQSLRSRKREHPRDELSETDEVTLHHQDTEGNNTAVDATLLQWHQPPLQESTVISSQQHQAAEQSCLAKQDPAIEEKHAEAGHVEKNEMVEAFEQQKETTVTNPNNDPQLQGFRAHTYTDVNKNNEETSAEECNGPPSQTCIDQPQVFLPTSEEDGGSCATALDEQRERNQDTSQEEPSNAYMADVKEIPKEAAAVLPARKKRRMGMCGLTEKERSRFLQAPNGHNGPESVEKQICANTANVVAQEEIISPPPLPSSLSTPAGRLTEKNEAEKKQSSHCGGHDRAEPEVCIAVTASDGTRTVRDPDCSMGQSCVAAGGIVSGPEQTGDKSDPPAGEEEEELLGNQEQQELGGRTAEIMAEKPQEQIKDGEDGSAVADQRPAISFYSDPTPNEETESRDVIEAALLQVYSVTRTRDEKKEELTMDAGVEAEAGASSTDTRSGRFSCGSVELCGAAVTPSGSERKDSCDPDDEPGAGPPTLNAEPPQTRDTADPFGPVYLDYVSDSQLNTIALIEEEVMQREEDLGSSDCHDEDATELICGLIRELSSLNRKVMATHRGMENLRHSSKSSRSSSR